MRSIRILLVLLGLVVLLGGNAFATTNSQILVMSNQLYQIAKDLTTGILPTSILLIAIGFWGIVNPLLKWMGVTRCSGSERGRSAVRRRRRAFRACGSCPGWQPAPVLAAS